MNSDPLQYAPPITDSHERRSFVEMQVGIGESTKKQAKRCEILNKD
jgi:hypothetical protein